MCCCQAGGGKVEAGTRAYREAVVNQGAGGVYSNIVVHDDFHQARQSSRA